MNTNLFAAWRRHSAASCWRCCRCSNSLVHPSSSRSTILRVVLFRVRREFLVFAVVDFHALLVTPLYARRGGNRSRNNGRRCAIQWDTMKVEERATLATRLNWLARPPAFRDHPKAPRLTIGNRRAFTNLLPFLRFSGAPCRVANRQRMRFKCRALTPPPNTPLPLVFSPPKTMFLIHGSIQITVVYRMVKNVQKPEIYSFSVPSNLFLFKINVIF